MIIEQIAALGLALAQPAVRGIQAASETLPHCESVVGFYNRMAQRGYRYVEQSTDEVGRTYRDYVRVTPQGTSFARYADLGYEFWCLLDETSNLADWEPSPRPGEAGQR